MHQVRADSKLLLAEYKSKLKQIIESHPSESIHFRQFIKLLSSHHILMHSKSQILKISRFFDNPLKLCRIQVPLAYLELDSVKICAAKRYFVAKVRSFTVYSGLLDGSQEKLHEVEECLAELMKRLRKFFGNQSNWFRELGGNSIAMTIDVDIFRSKIAKVLQNSPHIVCIKRLVLRFQKQGNKKEVEWKHFTSIIKNFQQNNELRSEDKKNNTFMTSFSLFSPTSAKSIDKSNSFDIFQRRHAESSLSSSTYRRKRPSKTLTNADNENEKQKGEFFRSFCLSSKKCVIYDKRSQQFSSTISSSLRATKTSKLTHRYLKTEKSFEQQKKQSHRQRKKEKVKLYTQQNVDKLYRQQNVDQLSRSQEQRNKEKIKQQQMKSTKQEEEKGMDNKMEEYVVLLENQSGVQIQI